MKIFKSLGIAFGIVLLSFGTALATVSPYPVSYSNWSVGNTITSAWLNTVEQMIGTGSTSTSLTNQIIAISASTSTKLGQISTRATTTGNILVASTTSGWNVLAVGPNGYCPTASSSAPLGIDWELCGGSINGTRASAYILNASGTGLSIIQNGATTTFQISSSSYLQPSNNLSELTNTSTARTNLGYSSGTNINVNNGTGVIGITGQIPVANGGTATSTASCPRRARDWPASAC